MLLVVFWTWYFCTLFWPRSRRWPRTSGLAFGLGLGLSDLGLRLGLTSLASAYVEKKPIFLVEIFIHKATTTAYAYILRCWRNHRYVIRLTHICCQNIVNILWSIGGRVTSCWSCTQRIQFYTATCISESRFLWQAAYTLFKKNIHRCFDIFRVA